MLNKAVYLVNIMLVLLWSYNIHSLWQQMSYSDSGSIVDHKPEWIPAHKILREWDGARRNLFETKPVEPPKKQEAAANEADAAANAKGLLDFTLQVRGIFTSAHQRFAVIDKIPKKNTKNKSDKESIKVSAGDRIADFTVSRIQSDTVTLKNDATGETSVLKIFKPAQAYTQRQPQG